MHTYELSKGNCACKQMEFEVDNHRPTCVSSNSFHTATFWSCYGWRNASHIHEHNTSTTNAPPMPTQPPPPINPLDIHKPDGRRRHYFEVEKEEGEEQMEEVRQPSWVPSKGKRSATTKPIVLRHMWLRELNDQSKEIFWKAREMKSRRQGEKRPYKTSIPSKNKQSSQGPRKFLWLTPQQLEWQTWLNKHNLGLHTKAQKKG